MFVLGERPILLWPSVRNFYFRGRLRARRDYIFLCRFKLITFNSIDRRNETNKIFVETGSTEINEKRRVVVIYLIGDFILCVSTVLLDATVDFSKYDVNRIFPKRHIDFHLLIR